MRIQIKQSKLFYSGHGTLIESNIANKWLFDLSNSAAIVPIDAHIAGCIPDTLLYGLVQLSSCPTLIITDCCYSGSMFALPFTRQYTKEGQIITSKIDNAYFWNSNIIMLSSTMNMEQGWYFYDYNLKSMHGVFTSALLYSLEEMNYNGNILDAFIKISKWVQSHGFNQTPMLSSSDINPDWVLGKDKQDKKPITPITIPPVVNDCCSGNKNTTNPECCSIQ